MVLIALLMLAQAQTSASPVIPAGVRLEATGSSSFMLEQPRLDLHGRVIRVEGVVCRRPLRLGSSPDRVRIDRVGTDGTVTTTLFASLPQLPRRLDQRCARYGVALNPAPVSGELLRICLSRAESCDVH